MYILYVFEVSPVLGVKRPGVNWTTHLHPVSMVRMSGAVPLHPPYAFMAWTWAKPLPLYVYEGKYIENVSDTIIANHNGFAEIV